jgi:hypothetical protein
MTSVSEIPVVRVPPPAEAHGGEDSLAPTFSRWKAFEVPQARRPSPIPLVLLALLAGIGAMVLGGAALVSATTAADEAQPLPPAPAKSAPVTTAAEQRVLGLIAKPSTDRVVFRGSDGRLVLVVGSAGRAAILLRGFGRAPAARPYIAWVVRGGKPVRAARFTGAERAIFLSAPVGRKDSVVVAAKRSDAARPGSARIVAVRR